MHEETRVPRHHEWIDQDMSEDEKKIILITDLVDQRLRKEQEIEYYEKELQRYRNV